MEVTCGATSVDDVGVDLADGVDDDPTGVGGVGAGRLDTPPTEGCAEDGRCSRGGVVEERPPLPTRGNSGPVALMLAST